MSKPLPTQNTFAGLAPPWSLTNLDANFTNIWNAINDVGTYTLSFADTGTVNALVANPPAGLTVALFDGLTFFVKVANTTTITNPTLNLGGLGAITIVDVNGGAISNNSLVAGIRYQFIYDGTNFRVMGLTAPSQAFSIDGAAGVSSTLWINGNGLAPATGMLVQLNASNTGRCKNNTGALILGAAGVDKMTLTGTTVVAVGPVSGSNVDMTPDTGSWTTTASGPWIAGNNVTGTLKWQKIGTHVNVWSDVTISQTATIAAPITFSGLPASITPSSGRYVVCMGVTFPRGIGNALGASIIQPSGVIQVWPAFSANATNPTSINMGAQFDNSGTAGIIGGWSISYAL